MLKRRILTALWGIPLLVAAIWFDEPLPWFTVLMTVWGTLAAFEFYRMVATANVSPLTYFGLIATLLLIVSPHLNSDILVPLVLTSIVVLPLIWLTLRQQRERAFARWAWTVAGILYIGWLLSHWVALRELDDGRNWVFFGLFTTIASDTGAYFIGKTLGRHYLAPSVSPGKTWEGAGGGVIAAIIISLFFVLPTPFLLPLSNGQAVFLGVAVSIFGQLGDLIESLFKRNMGVKEASRLLPGHGGALDRIDSIVLAGIVIYYSVLSLHAGWLDWLA
jgi:phosphatidate cytidylyltransferase